MGPRRREGQRAVALQARVAVRRVAVLRQRQPRRRRGRGQGLHDHPERPHHRPGRRDRQEGLGPALRRCPGRRERDGRAPGRQGHGHRRQLRRRVRLARPHRRVQARDRRARVALLHDPQAGRARLGDLAGRRRGLAARWRELLGHPARTTRTSTSCTTGPATPAPTSTAGSARATTSTPTPVSRSTPTRARSSRTSSTPRTTCGTTTPRWSTSCSTSMGRRWPPTSTRTGSSTSWTAPTCPRSAWSRSSTGSTGARWTRRAT